MAAARAIHPPPQPHTYQGTHSKAAHDTHVRVARPPLMLGSSPRQGVALQVRQGLTQGVGVESNPAPSPRLWPRPWLAASAYPGQRGEGAKHTHTRQAKHAPPHHPAHALPVPPWWHVAVAVPRILVRAPPLRGPDSAGTSDELSSIFPLTLSTCVHISGSRAIPPLLPSQYCPTLGAAILSRRSLLFSSSSMGSDVFVLDPSQSIIAKSIPIS